MVHTDMAPNKKLIGEMLRAGLQLASARNAVLTGFGLTGAKLRLLKMMRRLPVPLTVSELARAMNVTRQTVQATASALEAADLVRLTLNMRNRKAPLVVLTTLGQIRLEECLRVEERWIADLTRGFDERVVAQTEWVLRTVRERAGC